MRKTIKSWGATIDAAAWKEMKQDCKQLVIDAAKHERQKILQYLRQIERGRRSYVGGGQARACCIEDGEHWIKLKDL